MTCRIASAMIMVCLGAAPAARAEVVAYWTFDADTAADLSGNANHGTLVNAPGFSTDIPTTPGNVKSLDLTGSGDHVRVPHSPSLAMADAITVAYWVKGGSQSAWIRPISKSDGISGWEYQRNGANQFQPRIDTSGAINQLLGAASALDSTWHHVAMTLDNGLQATYMDGLRLASGGYNHGAGFANVYDLAIGSTSQTYGYGNYDLNGLLDEVVIYNESLMPNQVAHIAGGGDPTNLPAPIEPATVTSRLGTWCYEGYGGDIGYMSGLFTERATQFGLHLRGESVIDSFTIDQVDAANRHRIQDITVYASPTESYSFQLTDSQAPQTFSLPDVQTSYLLMTVDSRYTTGSSDFNMGISALSLTGTEIAPDVNLNAGIVPATVGGLGGWDFPARATDGTVHDGGTSPGSTDTATYFTRNAGQDSLTVNYGQPTSLNTIGLGIDPQSSAGAGAGGMRDIPRFVTLEYDGGSQQVDLWGDMFQYARYPLITPIADTSFLRMVFPDGDNGGDWYIHQDANYGITEFQAFDVVGGPAVVTSRLGTWSYEGYGGDIGYMSGLFTENATQFGLHLRGESVLDSFTIDQVDAAGRHRIQDITVYASPTESYSFQLTDSQAPQTFSLRDVRTSYLLMTVDSRYTTGSSDFNMGISALSLTGIEIASDVNLNAGIVPTTVGGLGGWDFPARVTDGTVHDGGTSDWSNDTATFFTRDAGQDSLTVNYAEPTSINVIGLGIDSQRVAGGGMRDIPRFVTLEYDGGSQQMDLWGDMFQYARYPLSTPITDTSFLRMVFPDGGSLGDWYIHQDANYGITEFQAFYVAAEAPVPEPSTFALAALGLLGLGFIGRWRRTRTSI